MDYGLQIADCGLTKTTSLNRGVCVKSTHAFSNPPFDKLTALSKIEGHSAFRNSAAFTLIEMLVVMALIGILAAMLSVVLISARRISIRLECQSNMHEIGTTLNTLMLNNNSKLPKLVDDNGYPWWAKVFDQWTGSATNTLDVDKDPSNGLNELAEQLAGEMKTFHCRMGGALQNSPDESDQAVRVTNLFNSISYGIPFDMKDSDGKPYHADRASLPASEQGDYSDRFPDTLTADDKEADEAYATQIKEPSRFILLSEADTQNPDPANWTGGRITMGAIDRTSNPPTDYPENAPIVGRHGGSANVLFADMSVAVIEVDPEYPTSETKNINAQTALWTLPAD